MFESQNSKTIIKIHFKSIKIYLCARHIYYKLKSSKNNHEWKTISGDAIFNFLSFVIIRGGSEFYALDETCQDELMNEGEKML